MAITSNDLPTVRGDYFFDAPLNIYSWFGVGGDAECLFIPKDVDDLAHFLLHKAEHIPIFVLGAGSNVLVRDGGIEGVVIKLGNAFKKILRIPDQSILYVGAAAMDIEVSNTAMQNNIGGIEFLHCIPGSIGGAITMNAGAYGYDMSEILVSVDTISIDGNLNSIPAHELKLGYRQNPHCVNSIFVNAVIQGEFCDSKTIKHRIDEMMARKRHSQPLNTKTCGSTFKNPEHHKAWYLIEESGCKGLRVGGAVISDVHCNFIVNDNNATASDIENLIALVKEKVYRHTSIMLTEELVIVGRKQQIQDDYEYIYIL